MVLPSRFQFRLSTFLLILVICAIAVGWLLDQRQKPTEPTSGEENLVEIYRLTTVSATDAAATLSAKNPNLSIVGEPHSNSLIVNGSKTEIEKLETSIERIDK